MQRVTRAVTLGVSLSLLLATGCAREYTVGDAIESQGAGLAEIGAEWSRGDDLVADGRSEVEKGKALIEKGRKRVQSGEAKISKGKRIRSQSEQAYRRKTGKALPEF